MKENTIQFEQSCTQCVSARIGEKYKNEKYVKEANKYDCKGRNINTIWTIIDMKQICDVRLFSYLLHIRRP